MEAVYYNSRKGGMHYPLAFIAMLILLLLNANSCSGGAAVGIQLVKSNATFGCNGRLECLIMEDDLELEILMNPYISRILSGPPKPSKTKGTGIPNKEAIPCGTKQDPKPYGNCIGKPKGGNGNHVEKCNSKYKRGCQG
ncbi:hypothetical protein I3760_04G053500 [Carya illinoinensis]|nr:hypothetical protein I3760_04G053500 [Carya illinoinensis]